MIGLEFEDNLLEDRFGPENGYAIYDTGLYTVLHIYLLPSSHISFEIEIDITFLHSFSLSLFHSFLILPID